MLPRIRFVLCALLAMITGALSLAAQPVERPNILWLVSEDNSPYIGAYGDDLAKTPTIDALAARGVLFENAVANAPVCAPARATIITGAYATSLGNHNMRSHADLPFPMFPSYLRKAGYYCTNNSKQDYNATAPEDTWDESSRQAHYMNRAAGQPFFAVFNQECTHESCLHREVDTSSLDPASVRLPPYHPDTKVFRERWSHYYHQMTVLDAWVADKLEELERNGLAEDTIVFYYADHGGAMPRSKRFLFESGVRVPMVVYAPEKWRHLLPAQAGAHFAETVTFVDLAPTVLSLAGAQIPEHMQGRAFMGEQRTPGSGIAHTFRSRMDEVVDLQRAVRTPQYIYIRNYLPYLPNGRFLAYLWRNPAMAEWAELYAEGKLDAVQSRFFEPKPPEQLFDIVADPHCVNDLSSNPEHRDTLLKLRAEVRAQALRVRDTGFTPEGMLAAAARGTTPYSLCHGPAYELEEYLNAADVLLDREPSAEVLADVRRLLADTDPVVNYWGIEACRTLGKQAKPLASSVRRLLVSQAPEVQIAAAGFLADHDGLDPRPVLLPLLADEFDIVRTKALTELYNVRAQYPVDASVLDGIPAGNYTDLMVDRLRAHLSKE